jgi:lipoprotein-anchoring transpeptidase ErfK/SrfK
MYLDISVADQRLDLIEHDQIQLSFSISTAKNGLGQQRGSECTPAGWHRIRAKIGAGLPFNSVLVGRRFTGEIYSPQLASKYPQRDWILSRILWLSGLEPGKNRYGSVDSGWRYIYIHGCPDHLIDGQARSHGCIRMKNADIIQLFDRVATGCKVFIH